MTKEPPPEDHWGELPLFTDFEHAGYSQVFWADDPHLPAPPWHQTDWRHAGGADSFFQALWPQHMKLRPAWEVLHLGYPGRNWMGRATPRADGQVVELAQARAAKLTHTMLARRRTTHDPFSGERLAASGTS